MNLTAFFDDDGHKCNSCGCVARISNAMAKFCPQCGNRYPNEWRNSTDPDELLRIVRKQLILGATEISVCADTPLTIRLEGRLRRLAEGAGADQIDILFESISRPHHLAELVKTGSTEFKYEFDYMLFANVSVFKKNGRKVIILQRNLDTTLPHATAG